MSTSGTTSSPIVQWRSCWSRTILHCLIVVLSSMLYTGCSRSSHAVQQTGEVTHGTSIRPSPKQKLLIQKAAKLYWIPSEYSNSTWLEGQIYAESAFNRYAKSSAGALGIAQFLPSTWEGLPYSITRGTSPYNEEAAIYAAAYYMRLMRNEWYRPRPELDRMSLARASYNAGLATVLQAQTSSGDRTYYRDILPYLPRETRDYEYRIRRYVVDRM